VWMCESCGHLTLVYCGESVPHCKKCKGYYKRTDLFGLVAVGSHKTETALDKEPCKAQTLDKLVEENKKLKSLFRHTFSLLLCAHCKANNETCGLDSVECLDAMLSELQRRSAVKKGGTDE